MKQGKLLLSIGQVVNGLNCQFFNDLFQSMPSDTTINGFSIEQNIAAFYLKLEGPNIEDKNYKYKQGKFEQE